MRKVIKKRIKIFITIIVTIIYALPSMARLDSSDGAAFVTKAEFDSVLADFNSRLTTFESGINSKIDSQVSAYLDRNGIWSAKRQILKNNTMKTGFKYVTADNMGWYETWGTTAQSFHNVNWYSTLGSMSHSNVCLVDKINKKGLCYIVYNTSGWSFQAVPTRNLTSDTEYWNTDNANARFNHQIDFYDGNATSIGSRLYSSIMFSGVTAIPVDYTLPARNNQTILFFIDRDIALWGKPSFSIEGPLGKYKGPVDATIPMTWTISSIDIY